MSDQTSRVVVALTACAIAFLGGSAHAQTSLRAKAVTNDPLEKLSQRMDAMEKRLQDRIDSLELRVRKLEQKPDNVDDDKNAKNDKSSGGKGPTANTPSGPASPESPPGQATSTTSQAVFNLIQRVTALERRNVVRAPFLVNDSQGHALFTVSEKSGADEVRGVRIFNGEGQPLVTLDASKPGGGVVNVASPSNEDSNLKLGMGLEGPQVEFRRNGNLLIRLWTTENENGIYLYGNSGNRTLAGLTTVGGTKGQVAVFNNNQTIAVLAEGENGGELELSDRGGTPMVQAGTLPTHVGIVRTGPASRAPGGLMGVPGSYITGKGN